MTKTPASVLAQARALAATAKVARSFFNAPAPAMSPESTSAQAREAKSLRRYGTRALRAVPAPAPGAWPKLLRLCADASDELGWAVEEAAGGAGAASFARAAGLIHDSAAELIKGLRVLGREAPLVAAKRLAGEAEHIARQARSAAAERPDAVTAMRLDGVSRRLARSAECLQEAADLVAEVLASR